MSEIKLKKDVLTAIVLTAAITFLISYAFFSYLPDMQRNSEVNAYKKALYDSLLCQYSCPLTLQNNTLTGEEVELPEQACVQACTESLKDLQMAGEAISNSEISNDNLVKDIESIVTSCRNTSLDQTKELPELDNEKFFTCVSNGLSTLKNSYSYLK